MKISKIISMIYWSRMIGLTVMLWLMYQLGLFNNIPPNSIIHYASPLSAFMGVALLAWISPPATGYFCAKVWSKITPIKNRPTIIEGEIVHILSILTSIPLFAATFLNLGITDIMRFLPLIGLASLPGSAISYITQVINKDAIMAASKQALSENEDEDEDGDETETAFPPVALNIIAYIVASVTFSIFLVIFISVIFFIKGELQSPILITLIPAVGLVALLMSIFGGSLLQLGFRISRSLGFGKPSGQMHIAIAWVLGIMSTTTVFVGFSFVNKAPTSLEALLALWPYIATYLLFTLSALASGFVLSRFYTPKPISVVFA